LLLLLFFFLLLLLSSCKTPTMQESSTYESTKARRSTQSQPDKIHWDGKTSFRDQPYRQLHHQRGFIGFFKVRLLEASDLKRSYWSPLALGPVRHLGLSKAHGDVSSFCSFTLTYADSYERDDAKRKHRSVGIRQGDWDKKPAAKDSSSKQHNKQPMIVSPVVPADNNPFWENCQFELPLRKGCMPEDGMRIQLQVRVDEDSTAVENIIPGIPSGGDSRLLGIGRIDITDLCLGESSRDRQSLPGVQESWIPISLPDQHKQESSEQFSFSKDDDPLAPPAAKSDQSDPVRITGMVRVLVTYEPVGLEPQPKDIVALEAFARRNLASASCRPLLQPLMPLTVVERRGSYLLCEYTLSDTRRRKACVRLHRNVVFVIERQNLADAAHDLALLPIDVVMSTPLGQAAAHALAPAAAAVKEVFMPALLTAKLLWMAARTTTLAGLSGFQALGSTLWQEGSSSLTGSHRRNSGNHSAVVRRDSDGAVAPFVQL
jgi:hypothetical protein